jgi:uncharacterized membrane protein YphA (DoxX/SURF4 family)
MLINYITNGLAAVVSLFLVIGGFINIIAPEHIRQDYERWGYPSWFHYVTGTLELVAAVMIILPLTRVAGSVLAGVVMAAAVATLIRDGTLARAILPALALLVIAANAFVASR